MMTTLPDFEPHLIQDSPVDNLDLAIWIKNNLEIDQGILEFYREGEPTSGWIHCSYSTKDNRNQWLKARREEGTVKYLPWTI